MSFAVPLPKIFTFDFAQIRETVPEITEEIEAPQNTPFS